MPETLTPLAGERKSNESDRAVQGCNDYLRMGPGRSLPKLHGRYTKSNKKEQPTDSLQTLKNWSTDFGWQKRAAEYDAASERDKNARRQKVFDTGLAQDHARVTELKKLAGFLKGEIYETNGVVEGHESEFKHHKVWLRDVKVVGGGEDAYPVTIYRFNSQLIDQYRGVLDDLAKEVGDRRQKQLGDASSPVHSVNMSLDEWRKQQDENQQQVADTMAAFEGIDDEQDE